MPEEIQTQKNTVATVGMRFSIIGLIALITVLFARFGFPLLFVGFILGIIGLFSKPRGRARVAIIIPLLVFGAIFCIISYIWSSIKTPATEFADRIKVEFQNFDDEKYDNERFNAITNEEFNNIFSSLTEEEFESLLEASTGSNMLEKGSYVIFGLLQQGFETSLERYNNELPAIESEESNTNEQVNEDNEEIVEIENIEIADEPQENAIEEILNVLE